MSKGIMFHHFHNKKHLRCQGSIDAAIFEDMLVYLQNKFCLINANDYLEKALNNNLDENHICLTFDDSLLCQYDIALPILNKKNISAFFLFIHQSLLNLLII